MELAQIQRSTFEPIQGEEFALQGVGGECGLRLVRVNQLKGTGSGRAPFSLLFQGPADPVYSQQNFTLSHADIGEVTLFMVPVGRDGDPVSGPVLYEAIIA